MNHARLDHLRGILSREFRRGSFDLTSWGFDNACGTVCCAAGWAAQDPDFNAQGLHSVSRRDYAPMFQDKYAFDALSKFFEIPRYVALYIFSPDSYDSLDRKSPASVRFRIARMQYEDRGGAP